MPSSARAHVHTALLYLRNGLTIVFKFGESVVGHELCAFHTSWVGYTALLYLKNDLANCVQI